MVSNVIHVTTKNFKNEVTHSAKPVLVDFYATWCMPCKMIAPILEGLAKEFEGQMKFVKVNVEEEHPLAMRYGISGVPTLMLFKGSIILDTVVGLPSLRALRSKLERIAEISGQQHAS